MGSDKKSIFRFSNLLKGVTVVMMVCLVLGYLSPYIHPSKVFFLPFFGLAYPIVFIFSLVLLIIWTFKKSRLALWILVLLLLGIKFHFRLVAFGEETEIPTDKTALKVLSYNIRIFDLYNADKERKFQNRDNIYNYVIAQKPDVVCFQEFYQKDNPTSFSTLKLFNEEFGALDHHERFAYKQIGRQHFGIVLFSKYPIIAKGDVIYETDDSMNFNFCIYSDIVKELDTFRVYNVHLQSLKLSSSVKQNEEEGFVERVISKLNVAYPKRANQAKKITEHIAASPYPVVVMGDFNDTPMSYSYHQFSRILDDAFLGSGSGFGTTYVGKIPAGRIDYIFHSPELGSTQFHIQDSIYSDHRAIDCTVYKR